MKDIKTKEDLQIEIKELEAKIAELENTESKSSNCLENSPVCTKVVDLDFNLQYMSNAGISALQIENVSAYYRKPYPLSFFPEAYNITMRENLLRAKETGEKIIQEGEVLDIKGNSLWFQASITPVYNTQGEIDHLLVVSLDTLARKQAEDKLLKSERKYRELVNLAQEGIWVIDKHNTTSFANPSMAKMLGYTADEMLGKSLFYFMDEAGIKIANNNIERRQAGIKEQHDFEFICKNGNRIITSMETAPIMDDAGNYEGAIAGVMNITERKQAEQLIQQNKNRLDYALKSIKTGAWELDLKTLGSWRTPKHDQLFGYNEPLDEWTYDMFLEHVIPEDREVVNRKFQHALENKTDWNFECRIKRNDDGEIRWIWANGNHELKENEDSLKMFGVVQDITEKKQIEQDLLDSQNNMLAVFNNTQDAQVLSKYNGENDFIIIAANKSYIEKINKFGLEITEEDIIGISLKELTIDKLGLSQDVYDYTIDFYLKVIETHSQVNHNEHFVLNKDNYYSETSYTPILNSQNGMSFVLYNSHDITEQRIAEEELVESMEQLSLSLEGANAGLWSWNIKTGEDLLDERWCAILGYTKAEIGQHVSTWESLMHPDDKDRVADVLYKHFEDEKNDFKQEYRMKCKNGQWKWIFAAGKIVKRGADGEPAQMTGIIIDIAEQKQAEEKRRTAEENLKNTFDISPSIIAKANLDTGYFIEVNQAVTRILGYSVEEFLAKPFIELIHPEDTQKTTDAKDEQLEGKEVTFFENRYLCKDGSYRWMAWHGTKANENAIVTAIGSDISESKLAQLKLNQSTQLLETSQLIAKLGGWELDIASNTLFWTAETYRIHDTSPEEFNPSEDAGVGYFLPESRRIISNALKAAKEDGKDYDLELETLTTKGRRINIRTTCVVTLHDGKPHKLTGIFQDITEQKNAEDKIRSAEKNLKNTFDLSPSIIAKANMTTGRFIQVNKAITKILGYTIEEFTSNPYMEFVHPDDRQSTIDEATEQLKGNEVTFFENRYLCKDGTYKWMAWHGTKPDKNGIVTTIGSDINERKTIEQEIIKTKQFYENVIEGVQDGIWVTDKNDVIYYANSAVEKIAGVSREQIQGNNILKDFPEETTGELIKYYKQAKKEQIPIWYNIKVRTLANKDTWQNGWLIPQYQNKIFTGIICSIRDVTERKKAELELIASKEKAEESDRLKSAFLANMSHEIRTPMNGILGFINLLNEPDLSKVEIEKYSTVINRSGKRLLTTINDIIDISRIESGEMVVIKEETSINSMMDELYSFHSPEATLKGLSLLLEPTIEQVTIITDSHKLHGILTNLIKNAIKFTENGSITFGYVLKKDTEPNKQRGSSLLEFFVEDTGIGIPEDRIQAVFRRFEQADIADIMAFEGSGLGLAISKAYVEMLGGEMHVESVTRNMSKGKAGGSKFVFTLPY